MKHTLETIAKLAGVSRGTVSRVINGQPGVKPASRERVLRIIDETGYYPNAQARSLAGGRTHNIGVVFFGQQANVLTHHLFYEVLQSIQSYSAANAYDLLLFANRRDSDQEYWKRIGDRGKVDGLIIMGEHIEEQYLTYYRERNIPFVLIGKRIFDELPLICVTSDYRSGAYEAVKHLIQQGRKQIAYIQGIQGAYHETERLAGYRQALEEAGIAFQSELLLGGDAEEEKARQETDRLLLNKQKIDAIFAGNDLMAFGAMAALRKHGIKIAKDVSVVGYDDIQLAAYHHPALTTVRQDKRRLGQEAISLLLEVIDGKLELDERKDVLIASDLIIRESS